MAAAVSAGEALDREIKDKHNLMLHPDWIMARLMVPAVKQVSLHAWLAAARKHGKACAMLCATEAQAKRWVQAGVEIIAYSSDSEVLARAYAGSMKTIRG
jgi:2-keto-3-deoxy-L-rhamnonate aldolase RhmA